MHNSKSGSAHFLAKTKKEAFDIVRKRIFYLPTEDDDPPYHYELGKESDLIKLGLVTIKRLTV
ncbi:hypothetical protein [Virgibacillus dokdonensis]|uniref:hypothetical protein n=1 Tax=Virgibacillus dokdonensis TaxID=302167 RepID=UPI0039E04EB1